VASINIISGALAADDVLKALGQEPRFRVRETPDWENHAADLETEMLKRGIMFGGHRLVGRSGDITRILTCPEQASAGVRYCPKQATRDFKTGHCHGQFNSDGG
jgi:hypothetical protein